MSMTLNGTSGIVTPAGLTINNAPAFSAYQNASTSVSVSTATKILFQVEEFDTNNNFASSTFTPTVAGYYQITATSDYFSGATTGGNSFLSIFKNGSEFKRGVVNATALQPSLTVSALVYCNGSTDYIDIYAFQSLGTQTTSGNSFTYFQGCMVRSA